MKTKFLVLSALLFVSAALSAQEKTRGKVSLEANLVWPFVPGIEIYQLRVPVTIWQNDKMKGDLVFGTTIRPSVTDDENAEKFSEYGLGLGYRHYIWKGLHIEPTVYFSYAKEEENKKDGKDYEGLAITTELYAGYKFDLLSRNMFDMYTIVQGGIGATPYQDLGPTTEDGDLIPVFTVLIGFNF